jgi:MFS family permease
MGTSNTEFSLLISAFSLNSTWTPLVGGLMASRLGTTYTSIFATGVILFGTWSFPSLVFLSQSLTSNPGQFLLLIGKVTENLRLMAFGLFIFGLGVSPLAVVQETIVVRFFRNHGLGVSMALGLVAGKGASFVSAHTSYPLSERYGPNAPFYVATLLAGVSVAINLVYISVSKWLIQSTGTQLEAAEIREEARNDSLSLSEAQALNQVAEKRRVQLREVTKLDDVFWASVLAFLSARTYELTICQ